MSHDRRAVYGTPKTRTFWTSKELKDLEKAMPTGSMVMYGVGVTELPDGWEFAPGTAPAVPARLATIPTTALRERAEAVMRWYQDVTLLRKPADRLKHSRPCKLWQALEASEWARDAGLPNVDDGELVSMWLHGRRERR